VPNSVLYVMFASAFVYFLLRERRPSHDAVELTRARLERGSKESSG